MTEELRTEDEIIEEYTRLSSSLDFFGTRGDLVPYLSWERAQPLMVEGATREEFEKGQKPRTREAVIEEMNGYLGFAFGKAHGERGISAGRSVDHYARWAWLLKEQALYDFIRNEDNYPMYGLPILAKVKHFIEGEILKE